MEYLKQPICLRSFGTMEKSVLHDFAEIAQSQISAFWGGEHANRAILSSIFQTKKDHVGD